MRLEDKIFSRADMLRLREQWKRDGLKVVFTNGCFDILHSGHVLYLEEAATLGDRLIIGLNSDNSVRILKGPTRPVNNQADRALVLAALASVSAVVLFDEETPLTLIGDLIPDILVKGGDWKAEQIVGSDIVLTNGGNVKSLMFKPGVSTTDTIERIIGKFCNA